MKQRLALWLLVACAFVATAVYVREAAGEQRSALPSAAPSVFKHSDGLSDSFAGYRLKAHALPRAPGSAQPLSFEILGPDGGPVTDFAIVQTVPLHLYVLRDDLSSYQHVHPRLGGSSWNTQIDVPDGGAYRVYVEFTPKGGDPGGHPTVLGVPFIIPGNTTVIPLPQPADSVVAGELTVSRLDGVAHLNAGQAALLSFRIAAKDGTAVSLQPYLGASGHLSAFEARTMRLSHMHSASGAGNTIHFHAMFPNRGEQRLFLQFKVADEVHLAAFTVFVT